VSTDPGASPDRRPEPARGLVLVVEDEPAIADVLRLNLRAAGYGVEVVGDGARALDAARDLRPSAIVLDIGLPVLDGIEVCRRLRGRGDWTPVLFVTARDDEVDRIVGLELGADDYITKPFSPRELVARLGGVLRRTRGDAMAPELLRVGDLSIDLTSHEVRVAGREIALTATEFDLLSHLMRRPGVVFTREQLLSDVWGYAATAGGRTVDVHVAQVRAKLGDASPIRTVRSVGYAAERAPRDAADRAPDLPPDLPPDRDAGARGDTADAVDTDTDTIGRTGTGGLDP
jgi:DNA-binding response OmpR family regulator